MGWGVGLVFERAVEFLLVGEVGDERLTWLGC